MAYAAMAVPSRRADMWFDGPTRQRRWTVLIRLILVIPQAIVLFFLAIALLVIVVIGWFAALFTGRLPDWAHEFIGGVVRWQTRVGGYYYLLTDHYPPFDFADQAYPVRPVLPANGKLNRLAVLFRFILIFPIYIFFAIVSYGLVFPLLFVTWVIMIFSGQMPAPLYWAYSAFLRYGLRFNAYLLLLTSEYPWGIMGDRVPDAEPGYQPPTSPAAWSPGSPPPYAPPAPYAPPPSAVTTAATGAVAEPLPEPTPPMGAPDTAPSPAESPGEAAAPVPPESSPAWPPPQPPPPPPAPWETAAPPPPPSGEADRGRLVLPKAARGWLIFAIVWGSVLFVGQIALQAALTNNVSTTASQYNTVVTDFNNSKASIQKAVAATQRCSTVPCLRASHLAAAASLQQFNSDLKAMNLPSGAQAAGQSVESDVAQLESAFTQLANSANAQAYRSTVQSSNLNTLLQSLPTDTNNLLNALNQSVF